MQCPRCHSAIMAGARFCARCGAPAEAAEAAEAAGAEASGDTVPTTPRAAATAVTRAPASAAHVPMPPPPPVQAYASPGGPAVTAPAQRPASQRPSAGAAVAAGIIAIVGAAGVVAAVFLPVIKSASAFGGPGTSFSLFDEYKHAAARWFLVEPFGVVVVALVAAVAVMASRGRAARVAAGVLAGIGLQTLFLFLGYWRGFASGQSSGPAGIVGILAGVALAAAGLAGVIAGGPRR